MPLASAADAGIALSKWRRLSIALAVALAACAFASLRTHFHPDWSTDLDQFWYACRAMFAGRDPYDAVGPGKEFDWTWPIFYPMPALLVASPFALLPLWASRIAFSTVGGFVAGYAIAPQWERRWPVLVSMAFFSAISRNQWSPFVLAAAWVPIAGAIVAIKPNVGLITLAVQDRRALAVPVGTACALVLASFAVKPDWVQTWFALVRHAPNKELAVLQPLGFLLIASLIAWRTVEGRVLSAMSVIPHTPSLYDLLPIFIATTTASEGLLVATCTHVLHWSVLAFGPYPDRDAAFLSIARWEVVFVLLPVLLLVLRRWWRNRTASTYSAQDVGLEFARPLRHALLVACGISLGIQIWTVTA